MKILITGNYGFIGYWLSKDLLDKGHDIMGIDDLSSNGERQANYDNSFNVAEQLEVDLCNYDDWRVKVSSFKPEIVLHVAAQAILPRCYRDPSETVYRNVISTQNILKYCNDNEVISLVCITSDKVYENLGKGVHFSEEDKLGGKDAYSISKTTCEMLCKAHHIVHRKNKNLSIQTARLGNVVGGGDWSVDRLLPDLMRAINSKKIFNIRYMDATRPFQHVSDVVNGINNLWEHGMKNKGIYDYWNIGPKGNSYCYVREVIELTKKHFGDFPIQQSKEIYKEDLLLAVDNSKYVKFFGEPNFDSIKSIDLALQWYKENRRS